MTIGEPLRRRLAAILAADIAGHSRLMGQDEAATVATSSTPPAMGILAEFPSVVGATECAAAI
jgi:adenylate cyclase